MSRRESVTVGRPMARKQSSASAPITDSVTVAVLPPRLPAGFAPPSGITRTNSFSWDDRLNYQHNETLPKEEDSSTARRPSIRKKMGLTTERKRANTDLPPFVMKTVPYETWRKHYAKDKEGNYKGTHAPAEDCLLKPDDLQKWRFEEGTTYADKWTRGKEILPVYEEVAEQPRAPEYEVEYDGPPRDQPYPFDTMVEEDDPVARREQEEEDNVQRYRDEQRRWLEERGMSSNAGGTPQTPSEAARGVDGRQIPIENSEAPKLGWRKKWKKGLEAASMST